MRRSRSRRPRCRQPRCRQWMGCRSSMWRRSRYRQTRSHPGGARRRTRRPLTVAPSPAMRLSPRSRTTPPLDAVAPSPAMRLGPRSRTTPPLDAASARRGLARPPRVITSSLRTCPTGIRTPLRRASRPRIMSGVQHPEVRPRTRLPLAAVMRWRARSLRVIRPLGMSRMRRCRAKDSMLMNAAFLLQRRTVVGGDRRVGERVRRRDRSGSVKTPYR